MKIGKLKDNCRTSTTIFNSNFNDVRKSNEKLLKQLNISLDKFTTLLYKERFRISKNTNQTYESLLDIVKVPDIIFNKEFTRDFNKTYLMTILNNIVDTRDEIKKTENIINKLKLDKYSENNIKSVFKIFNSTLTNYIIQTGQDIYLGHGLNFLGIRIKPYAVPTKDGGVHLRIDWNKSNLYKQQLISDGKTPKSPENPDGELWHIYHTEETPFWLWGRSQATAINKSEYKFIPSKGDFSIITKLHKAIKSNPKLMTFYVR